jgi:hypothetical protein
MFSSWMWRHDWVLSLSLECVVNFLSCGRLFLCCSCSWFQCGISWRINDRPKSNVPCSRILFLFWLRTRVEVAICTELKALAFSRMLSVQPLHQADATLHYSVLYHSTLCYTMIIHAYATDCYTMLYNIFFKYVHRIDIINWSAIKWYKWRI